MLRAHIYFGFTHAGTSKEGARRARDKARRRTKESWRGIDERSDGAAAERAAAVSGAGEASEGKGGSYETKTSGGRAAEAEPDEAAGQEQVTTKVVVRIWNEVAH
jgi:hypothetical protein